MPPVTEPHDLFISYAREDTAWVRRHLYEPLRRCRTAAGRPPRIFFDVGEDGIQVGQDFKTAIDSAIENGRKFVPVYSATYFQKDMCIYELELAQSRDMNFRSQILLPLLIEDEAIGRIPFAFRRLNFLSITDPDWFRKLCNGLELDPTTEELALSFLDEPGDVFANHTLPIVRVAVQAGTQPISYDEEITLSAEQGRLLGTLTVKTQDGVAVFDDLSIGDAVGQTRLIASSPTVGQQGSALFSVYSRAMLSASPAVSEVTAPDPVDKVAPSQTVIPTTGDAVFFATGRALAVIQPQQVLVYSIDGRSLLDEPVLLRAPIRLIRRRGPDIVLADWQGNIIRLGDDGQHREWRFGENVDGFVVPADAEMVDGSIYVSFWSGSVFRLEENGGAELIQKDPAGIQATCYCDDRLFTCDFSGNLRVYRNRRLVNTATLEPTIWLLIDTPTCLVAVGDQKFYHLKRDGTRVIGFDMPLGEIASVYELSDLPIVTDTQGKGIRFDAELTINATVFAQPGAEPVSADHAGKYCVFRNLDETRTLLLHDRIVFSNSDGCLAVNPLGNMFAIGDRSGITLYTEAELGDLVGRQEAEMKKSGGGKAQ